ncbi:MAG: hypothetical protein ABIS14_14060 [Sphingomonas sp.]
MIPALDTSKLGPIRVEPARASQARNLLADAVLAQGTGYRNAADSIRAGSYGNIWTIAAEAAIAKALQIGPDDDDE